MWKMCLTLQRKNENENDNAVSPFFQLHQHTFKNDHLHYWNVAKQVHSHVES